MSDANEHRYDTGQTVWLMLFGHEIMGTIEEVLTHPNPERTTHYLVEYEHEDARYRTALPEYRIYTG